MTISRDALIAVGLFAVAAALNVTVASLSAGPGSADAAFYASAADAIAHGHFSVPFLWSFNEVGAVIPANPQLPVPIGGHWLPGAAIVAAPFVWAFGPGWPAPALGSALIGAVAAPVAFRLALDLDLKRPVASAAGVTVALGGALLPFLSQPDNHGLSAGLGSLCLLLAGRAALGSGRALVVAAACGGAMMLVRNDGLLYVLPLLSGAWIGRKQLSRRQLGAAALVVVAILGTWWVHQLLTFGALSPSAAAGRSLWILDLHDFNRLGPLTLNDFLANGLPAIAASRITGLWNALLIHSIFLAVGILLPFAAYQAVLLRRSRMLAPTLLFVAAFFAAAVVVFSAHIPNGFYIRSGAALLPVTVVLGLAGVERLVRRIAPQRLARSATVIALASVVVLQIVLAATVTTKTLADWQTRADRWHWVAAQLDTLAEPGDRIETLDAANAYWYTHRDSVVTPTGSKQILLDVASAYGLGWVVVFRDETVPATEDLVAASGETWLGPAVARLVNGSGVTQAAIYRIPPRTAVAPKESSLGATVLARRRDRETTLPR